MPRIGDFSASVLVEGRELEEYDIQVDEIAQTATCWIPSEAGKEYSVRSTNHGSVFPSRADLAIDGNQCGGIVTERIPQDDQPLHTINDGLYTSSTTKAPFIFSSITTSDEETLLTAPATPDVGLIKLVIHNVYVRGREPCLGSKPPEAKTFHEKTKKGISHQTRFDRSISVPAVCVIRTDKLGPPVATFHFRYRPLGILQAQDIAPRPPPARRTSPSPHHSTSGPAGRKRYKIELDSDGEVIPQSGEDEDDSERLKQLQREMDSIRARRNQKGTERPRKRVKREPVVGETIDLTLDD